MFETPTLIFGIVGAIIAIVGCLVYVVKGGGEKSTLNHHESSCDYDDIWMDETDPASTWYDMFKDN